MTIATRMLGALALGLLLAGQAPAPAPVAPPPSAADQAMAARAAAFPASRAVEAVEAYTPALAVKGATPNGRGMVTITPDAAGFDAARFEAAVEWARARDSYAFIVARDGAIVAQRYFGERSPAARYSTASMHKAVLALAYGIAIADGRIALADPVGRHLPEWRDDPRGRVTIGQLLTMTSGLAFPPAPPGPPQPGAPLPVSARLAFTTDSRALALSVPQDAPPGTRFAYSNLDSQIAGEALTAALGGDYAGFLSARLWQPLEAGDAALWLDREGGSPKFYCCLQAMARDWVRVGELIRNAGRVRGRQLVPADWIAAMTVPGALNANFGMNVWRGHPHAPLRRYSATIPLTVPAAQPFARDDVLFIDGAGGQRVYVIPSERLTIVRIGAPRPDWDDSALPNLVLAALAAPGR